MAYAAVIFLKHTILHLWDPEERNTTMQMIGAKMNWLAKILEGLDGARNRSINWSRINEVDAEIRDAVWELEDVLQSYAFDGTLPPCRGGTQEEEDDPIGQYANWFLSTVKMLEEKYTKALYGELLPREEDDCLQFAVDGCGSRRSTTVGTFDQLERIVTELLDQEPGLKTVSLFGMAGIGKTHLATEIYHHPLITQHFDSLLWVRVGPRQHVKNVWADVIAQVEGKPKGSHMETNIITLVGILLKSLSTGRRYLIVLDDMWSSEACDGLMRVLRSDGNGTRVLVTTRLEDVAKYLDSSIHQKPFLTNEESWELLWQNVFDEGDKYSFPPQLEEAGRKIAEKCEGLPLLILTVADILRGLDKTQEYWNKVADEKTTTFTDAYDKIAKVLFSSYQYLPQYLKPCFLYSGVFPQRCKIAVSKLIYLLTVEDFMESERSPVQIMRTPREALSTMSGAPPRKSHVKAIRRSLSIPLGRRVTKSFETLYLLEPGPSLARFITPFEKIESFKQELSIPIIFPVDVPLASGTKLDTIATKENFAMECVERLVANSLVIVCKKSSKFRLKSCKLTSANF